MALSIEGSFTMPTQVQARALFDPPIVRRAIIDSFLKLDPRHQVKNPVMFVVEVGSVLTTLLFLQALVGHGEAPAGLFLRSRCGCGSPWFSPTLRRPWPKAAARPRPTRCAEPGAMSWPRNWRAHSTVLHLPLSRRA